MKSHARLRKATIVESRLGLIDILCIPEKHLAWTLASICQTKQQLTALSTDQFWHQKLLYYYIEFIFGASVSIGHGAKLTNLFQNLA